ncbi:thiamine pyrophosphate-dependent dehydrogenase E1 component subunit alpha [Pollutimonas harenae]|uniref:Thiamine pyrophosphate-dependent dehydrogenase E1 component subunit alpha n=1 Tax=Pollutimonas harenae TaxID=657015 RepID=A0A853H1Q4_9BURK|nr:thiamine pyrophosphate-dependent dehydrogenase E1 component subunit alpha [Pollutimonas harenae]NYT85165.1 thiamine pyrophosphate-dependent dehydrogenase E1 component subunit alpha [Pollutimonas harenae]TEA72456.1 thiamine pyrophosphate-dependent dehydrogenase E1 component subunit alpha [Pollutimonas harenae]
MSTNFSLDDRGPELTGLAMMYQIRFLEEKITELRKQQTIQGSVHLCIGQEAIYTGSLQALNEGDQVFSTYRGHGWALACGVPASSILAELLGRETGVNKGRGGSAYFSAADWGFYGENSIVGAGAPIACGAALSNKLKRNGALALTAFGDGAMNQGAIHEAMNFASYLELPVLFICENNTYSELTPIADMTKDSDLYKRAQAYGMRGVRIDGNDLEAVRSCVQEQASTVRAGKGPVLIEMMTQRLVGHYYGDMQSYRPKGELTEAKRHEPIVRMRQRLQNNGVQQIELDEIEANARAQIEQASQEALAAPMADTNTVLEHLYA